MIRLIRRQSLVVLSMLVASVLSLTASYSPLAFAQAGPLAVLPNIAGVEFIANSVPTDAQCRASASHRPCYSPQEFRTAYGIAPIIAAGYDGKGQTIVIIDSFGSPTIASDLQTFDTDYGLPAPAPASSCS